MPLTLAVLFAVATSAGDARRQQDASQCAPSTILAPRVATIEQPMLSVEQNQFFVISLGSNPSTGYHWIVGQAKPYPFGIVGTTVRQGAAVAQQNAQPTVGAGAEQLLILKATAPAGVETIEMHYVPANVVTLDGRRGPAPGEVVGRFTIQITAPAHCSS